MAFLTNACTAAGSSSFRWPVTPMRIRYGIDSNSGICTLMSYILYHRDHELASRTERSTQTDIIERDSAVEVPTTVPLRLTHRRDEELANAQRAIL